MSTSPKPLEPSDPITFLISNTSKPVVRIGDQEFTTASLAEFARAEAGAAAFAAEIIETADPLLVSHPVLGVTTTIDYVYHILNVGISVITRPPPPPRPTTAPAPPSSSSSVLADASRTPTRHNTPLPPTSPAATASPPRKKAKKRKHGTSLPDTPPPPPASPPRPHPHPPTPAPPSPIRVDPPPRAPSPVHPPPPSRPPYPPSAAAFDKVLSTLASLRRKALKLTRRRSSRASSASAPGPWSRPSSYAAAVRGSTDPKFLFPAPFRIYFCSDPQARRRGKEPRR